MLPGRTLAVTNQKGGVGKTTTAVHLAHALMRRDKEKRILLVDLDQGNSTQAFKIKMENVRVTAGDLIRDKNLQTEYAICRGKDINLDIIPATPDLSNVEREMVGLTNAELRLTRKLDQVRDQYAVIILDTPPTFGSLMNSALNCADELVVPVDCNYYAVAGIKKLLGEVQEIKTGTNPRLKRIHYLLTFFDHTNISHHIADSLIAAFGEDVFETKIRRSVRFREASALSQTIFSHAESSQAAEDYLRLVEELLSRWNYNSILGFETKSDLTESSSVVEVCHE